MKDELRAITAAPGRKYTWLELDQAIRALESGQDINYEGVSGPIELNDKGDATAGVYDVYKVRKTGSSTSSTRSRSRSARAASDASYSPTAASTELDIGTTRSTSVSSSTRLTLESSGTTSSSSCPRLRSR